MKANIQTLILGLFCTGLLMSCQPTAATPTPIPTEGSAPIPSQTPGLIDSFESCAAAGNPVMESYPQRCAGPDGTIYTEDIGNELDKLDLIRIDSPRPNALIRSPLQIAGEARGSWFFEADFPIELLNDKGEVIGMAIAQAQGEWMTEEFVPFTATLPFDTPAECRGTLVLIKDNPSDLEELDDELQVPVKFCSE